MVDPSSTIQSFQPIAQQSGMGFFKVLSYSFLGIYIFLLLVNTMYIAVDQHSIMPVLKNLGDTFLLSTQHISDISKEIIANNGGYNPTDDFWTGIWNYIVMYGKLYVYLYTILCWFKILIWIFGHSPLSDTSQAFKNFGYSFATFYLLQAVLLLAYAGVNKDVNCFYGCDRSAIYWIELPIMWIVDFVIAIPLLLRPTQGVAQVIVGNSTI